MKNIVSTGLLIVGLLLSAAAVAENTTQTPDGYFLVDEAVLELLLDEPEDSFFDAEIAFLANKYEDAAREIRRAAAILRLEGDYLKNKGSDLRLGEAAIRLESLAVRVEEGEVADVHSLHTAFAHAQHTLGTAYTMEGEKYWEQKLQEDTRHALLRAKTRLTNAAKWSKAKISTAGKTTMFGISALTEKTDLVADSVTTWFKSLQTEANTIGEKIEDDSRS